MKYIPAIILCNVLFTVAAFSQIAEPKEMLKLINYVPKGNEIQGKIKTVAQGDFEFEIIDGAVHVGDIIQNSLCDVEFNSDNMLIVSNYFLYGVQIFRTYQYDENKKLIQSYNSGVLDFELFYDNKDNITRQTHQIGFWTYVYDENGNCIEKTGYSGGSFMERWLMKYDDQGRLVEAFMTGEEPDTTPKYVWSKYQYNQDGKLSRIEYFDDQTGSFTGRFIDYKYNDAGDLILRKDHRHTYTYKYSYDKNMNWVQRITLRDKEIYKFTGREIEYW